MGAPPCLRAAGDHICVGIQSGEWSVRNGFDFFLGVVMDAEALGDAVDDEDLLSLM